MGRKNRKRYEDLAAVEADDATPSAWDVFSKNYPADIRAEVDAVRDLGGLSLADLELLEFAEFRKLSQLIEWMVRVDQGRQSPSYGTMISSLSSLALQSRKNMRVLRMALSPVTDPTDRLHPDAAALLERAKAFDLVAATMAALEDDEGDDLVT